MWEHFKKFAMYDDYQELYEKCVPAIAKFEGKMANYYAAHE